MNHDGGLFQWEPASRELVFRTAELAGRLQSVTEEPDLCNHRVHELVHLPTGRAVSASGQARGMLSLFRATCEGRALGELRAMEQRATPLERRLQLEWDATPEHAVRVEATWVVSSPRSIDLEVRLLPAQQYQGYQILLAGYLPEGFRPGCYVADGESGRQVRPEASDVLDGMWPFFPRDGAAAHSCTDGRFQAGRWPFRVLAARYYSQPLVFFSDGELDVLLMGRSADVAAVGMAYAGNEVEDPLAAHRSFYLSLFGCDLKAGQAVSARARLLVEALGADAGRHQARYQEFLTALPTP
jgi:hypothetical protein